MLGQRFPIILCGKGEKVENKGDLSLHIHTFTNKSSCWEV